MKVIYPDLTQRPYNMTVERHMQARPAALFEAWTSGFERWSRNIAVALGNAPPSSEVIRVLEERRADATPLVREHIEWALARQRALRSAASHRGA